MYEQDDLEQALRVLEQGGVILYPTDTIWGIGCDATCQEAVQRIYRIKQREDSKALLLLVDSEEKLRQYVVVSEQFQPSQAREWSGGKPTTIIYPRVKNLPTSLLAADGSVGIRITQEPFSRALCEKLRKPLVSTSANLSGMPSAQCFAQVSEQIRRQVDYICRYRRDDFTPAQPSAILRLLENENGYSYAVLRK